MAESICVGYARVSSKDQNEERQTKMLKEAGVPERYIFIDKESGRDYNRDKWNAMMTVIRKGDTVFVCSLDRLGRNYTETGKQWEHITKEIGADIVVLDMPILDTRKTNDLTGTLIADIVLKVLSYVAEKERINTLCLGDAFVCFIVLPPSVFGAVSPHTSLHGNYNTGRLIC